MKKILLIILPMMLVSGCASYRTGTGVDLGSPEANKVLSEVDILETALPEESYKSLGQVEATVKKLTAFHKDPTKEQANNALAEEAKKVSADTVINTIYKSGVGLTTWGYIKASGEAVKKN